MNKRIANEHIISVLHEAEALFRPVKFASGMLFQALPYTSGTRYLAV